MIPKLPFLVAGIVAVVGLSACRHHGGSKDTGADQDVTACEPFHPAESNNGVPGAPPATDGGNPRARIASVVLISIPATGDTNVRGTLDRPDHVAIEKVFIAGVPATDDGSDFSSFDATVPFSVLVGKATRRGNQLVATVDVTAITNCDVDAVVIGTGTVSILVAPKEVTYLKLSTPTLKSGVSNYFPTTLSEPIEIDLEANPGAAGASVMLSTTMGTISGSPSATVLLSGNGVDPATATAFLAPDPTKQGTAYVTAQAPNARGDASASPDASVTTVTAGINMYGPPSLFPAAATLAAGQTMQIGIVEHGALVGCVAAPAPGLTLTLNGEDLTTNIVRVASADGGAIGVGFPDAGIPVIEVAAALTGAGGSSSMVTCFDAYQQVGTATVTGPKS